MDAEKTIAPMADALDRLAAANLADPNIVRQAKARLERMDDREIDRVRLYISHALRVATLNERLSLPREAIDSLPPLGKKLMELILERNGISVSPQEIVEHLGIASDRAPYEAVWDVMHKQIGESLFAWGWIHWNYSGKGFHWIPRDRFQS